MSARVSQHAAYIGRVVPGTSSNYGVMCERIAAEGGAAETCRVCEGTGIRLLASDLGKYIAALRAASMEHKRSEVQRKFADCPACKGSGAVECRTRKRRYDKMFTTVRCGRCRGTGSAYAEDYDDTCPACREFRGRGEMTTGYTVPITARATGSSKKGTAPPRVPEGDGEASYMPDLEGQIERYGRQSRRYERLRKTHPIAAAALAAFEGEEGSRWAMTKWGRIFALWPLTKPGRKLIQRGREASLEGTAFLLDDMAILANERNADETETHPNPRRRAWIRRADADARKLLDAAQVALREVA